MQVHSQDGPSGDSTRHLLQHAYLLPMAPEFPPEKPQRSLSGTGSEQGRGEFSLCCHGFCSGTHRKGTRQQGTEEGTGGHIVSWLSLGKESAWTEGQREAAPAAALEVSLPCLKVILGEVAKDQKKS